MITENLFPIFLCKFTRAVMLYFFCIGLHASTIAQQLYGTTQLGGTEDVGTIIKYDGSTNTATAVYSMSATAGASPFRNDLLVYNGKLYGMTNAGGVNAYGIIFEYDPATLTYTKKIDFNGTGNGALPEGSLTLVGSKFYGMTNIGGLNNRGVIFEYDPATNIITRKINFSNANGSYPKGSLTAYNGKLYGLTSLGGANSRGVIFEYDPATNTYTRKISFNTNGRNPQGNLTVVGSKLYGMTELGGTNNVGVIFEYDPATNVYTKKIDMSVANGSYPKGSFALSGSNLYALTSEGGTNGAGVIFEWNPATNVYARKHNFDGTNGSNPQGNLTLSGGGIFYGMTGNGGTNILGTIFEWNPTTNIFTKKIDLDGTNMGSDPAGSLTLVGSTFYGLTYTGGAGTKGTLFEWQPATNTFSKKLDFDNSSNGKTPVNGLTLVNDKFYSATYEGGANNVGVIFEFNPNTNVYSKLYDFEMANGAYPSGELTLANGKLYGMTPNGGANGLGVIFEFNPTTNVYTKLYDFSFTSGYYAMGSLSYYNGKLYGTASMGGASGMGVLFELDPSTNVFTKKYEFDYVNGNSPQGTLVLYNDKFYGLTSLGSFNNMGVLFEWNPATNVFVKHLDFDGANNGSEPRGSLTLHNNKLYGTTFYGGTNNLGTVFEFDPLSNTLTKKINMTAANGSYPSGSFAAAGSKLYGLTSGGGTNDMGVLFEWEPSSNTYTKRIDFNGSNGNLAYRIGLTEYTSNPLPVSLLNFHGKRANNEQVRLSWKTASETQNKGFDIEISYDGQLFKPIDFVQGQGNSSKMMTYDVQIANSKSAYYRLKQLDFDGAFTYSASIFVAGAAQNLALQVFPNPSNGLFQVRLAHATTAHYMVLNTLGQELMQGKCAAEETTSIDLRNMPKGVYWLRVVGENTTFTQRLVTE